MIKMIKWRIHGKNSKLPIEMRRRFFAEKSDSVKWNDQYLSMRLSIATYTGKRGME